MKNWALGQTPGSANACQLDEQWNSIVPVDRACEDHCMESTKTRLVCSRVTWMLVTNDGEVGVSAPEDQPGNCMRMRIQRRVVDMLRRDGCELLS